MRTYPLAMPHPNPECRDQSRYHVTGPRATELEVGDFLAGLVRLLQPRAVIETGTCDADSSFAMAKALAQNGHGRLATVEIERDKAEQAAKRLVGLPADVILADAVTLRWETWRYAQDGIDLAFIDGGKWRGAELLNAEPFMPGGAFVVFHDVANGLHVEDDVESLAVQGVIGPVVYFPTPRGLALARIKR